MSGNPSASQIATQTVQVLPMSRAAVIAPTSANDDNRTVELTFTTGADVERRDFWTGERWIERLSLAPGAVRLDRLNSGAPLLDSHGARSIRDTLGSVVPGTAKVSGKRGLAIVQFSRSPDLDRVWQDVRDGIIRNVSVGYRVHRFEVIKGKAGAAEVRVATDWEPYEVSMVAMPADARAQTRGAELTNHCEFVTRTVVSDEDRRRQLLLARAKGA